MRYWVVALALAVLLGLPSAASAAWNNCGVPGLASSVGDVVTQKSRLICHDTAAATATDSTLLDVSQCDHIDLAFDPAAASTNTGAEAQLYRCTVKSIASEWCAKMLVDTDGDGIPDDVTLDGVTIGRQGQQWQTAAWVYVDMTTAPSGTDVSRLMITCY